MMIARTKKILTVEELIAALEHIELDQLYSDIPANVRAELRYMKRNASAILEFVSCTHDATPGSELYQAMIEVRRECIALNGTISKLLLLMHLPLRAARSARCSLLAEHYETLARTTRAMCALAAPQFAPSMAAVL